MCDKKHVSKKIKREKCDLNHLVVGHGWDMGTGSVSHHFFPGRDMGTGSVSSLAVGGLDKGRATELVGKGGERAWDKGSVVKQGDGTR